MNYYPSQHFWKQVEFDYYQSKRPSPTGEFLAALTTAFAQTRAEDAAHNHYQRTGNEELARTLGTIAGRRWDHYYMAWVAWLVYIVITFFTFVAIQMQADAALDSGEIATIGEYSPDYQFFLGWWLWALWVTHRGATGPPLWCHVMLLIGVLEFAYYDMMPTQLHLMMVAAAVAWRDREAAQAAAAERRSRTRDQETLATT